MGSLNQSVKGSIAGLSPSSYNFGTVYLGQVPGKIFTLTNTGNGSMSAPVITITTPGNDLSAYGFVDDCIFPLLAGHSCNIVVGFAANEIGTDTATLKLTDNSESSPQTAALSATVINPKVSLSPTSLSFGTQKVNTTSAAKTVTLTNSGTTTLMLNTLSISGNYAIASGTTCTNGDSLMAGSNCKINLTFTPTAKGTRIGTLTITDNALNSPQAVALSGTGD